MSQSPTFAEVLRTAMDSHTADLHVAMPGRVESYDSTNQSVSVQPLIRRGYTGEDGERAVESLPVITGVPVVFPGTGGVSITWPVAAGDTVLLVFSESSIDKWLSRGGEVDPLDDRKHTLSDAIAIPGLRDFANPVPPAGIHSTAMVITAPLIHAGGTDSLALKSDVSALKSWAQTFATTVGYLAPLAPSPTGTSVLKGS